MISCRYKTYQEKSTHYKFEFKVGKSLSPDYQIKLFSFKREALNINTVLLQRSARNQLILPALLQMEGLLQKYKSTSK